MNALISLFHCALIAAFFLISLPAQALCASGNLDPSFGAGGIVLFDPSGTGEKSSVWSVASLDDGKILAGGYSGDQDFVLARFNGDGSLDTTFGVNGFAPTDVQSVTAYSIAVQDDGRILVAGAGIRQEYFGYVSLLWRFTSNGMPDSTFGVNGKVVFDVSTLNNYAAQVTAASDGKILLSGGIYGRYSGSSYLYRFNADGSLDDSFQKTFMNGSFCGGGSSHEILPDGSILFATYYCDMSNVRKTNLIRLSADGTQDTGFGTIALDKFRIGSDRALRGQDDGKILLAGESSNGDAPLLLRLNGDGRYDQGFGDNGTVAIHNPGVWESVSLQPDGAIIVAGTGNSYDDFAVGRFTALGDPDSSFGINGLVFTGFSDDMVGKTHSMALQNDGNILIAGSRETTDESSVNMALLRYLVEEASTLPTVTTASVSHVTPVTAQSGGAVTSDGGGTITAQGVCWNTTGNPTLEDQHTVAGSGGGEFSSELTDLTPVTAYHLRAYATNSLGTAYGPDVAFSTTAVTPPVLNKGSISHIASTSAYYQGEIRSTGGLPITASGVCVNTTGTPTLDDTCFSASAGSETFSVMLTKLTPEITYFARGYATNMAGTGYGEQSSFNTVPGPSSVPVGAPWLWPLFFTALAGLGFWIKRR